jgi:hypothetical protein
VNGVVQVGANQTATITQNSQANIAGVIQAGSGLKASVSQTGTVNAAAVVQFNTPVVSLLGN